MAGTSAGISTATWQRSYTTLEQPSPPPPTWQGKLGSRSILSDIMSPLAGQQGWPAPPQSTLNLGSGRHLEVATGSGLPVRSRLSVEQSAVSQKFWSRPLILRLAAGWGAAQQVWVQDFCSEQRPAQEQPPC